MKNSVKLSAMAMILFLAFVAGNLKAQDVVKTNPKNTKLLSDTAGTRMILVWWKPGQQLTVHTHPTSEMYVLSGGQLTVSHVGGTIDTLNIKTGDYMHQAPEGPHTTKNTGTTNVKILLVEIKKK